VDGGYRVTARKRFASGAPASDLLMTSAVFADPEGGPTVLHFPVPLTAPGVRLEDTWHTLGMRATGSHDLVLDGVSVPEGVVSLRRPRGEWHAFFNVICACALPLIMAVYLGVAEEAAALALDAARQKADDPTVPDLLGELEGTLVTARMAVQGMFDLNQDYAFAPVVETANAVLVRKTIAARVCVETVEQAMAVVGGGAFYRRHGIERLLRDVHGAPFHPLPEKRQHRFSGRLALGLDPAG
jgi:alkylation response protein AidB-like acyl-CoA dehydrogenase